MSIVLLSFFILIVRDTKVQGGHSWKFHGAGRSATPATGRASVAVRVTDWSQILVCRTCGNPMGYDGSPFLYTFLYMSTMILLSLFCGDRRLASCSLFWSPQRKNFSLPILIETWHPLQEPRSVFCWSVFCRYTGGNLKPLLCQTHSKFRRKPWLYKHAPDLGSHFLGSTVWYVGDAWFSTHKAKNSAGQSWIKFRAWVLASQTDIKCVGETWWNLSDETRRQI